MIRRMYQVRHNIHTHKKSSKPPFPTWQSKKPAGQINVASANQIAPSTLHPTLHQSKSSIYFFWAGSAASNHSTTHRAQHTQQHTAHTRAKPTNLSPAGRLGGTPTAHKRETCHRHSRGRLVDPRTQLHRTRPQGQKLGPKDRISCGPANLATSSNPRRQVGSSRGFGGIPLHQMSSLKVGVRSLERVWWMLQSWRQRQQQ